jgi:hypothetical protein
MLRVGALFGRNRAHVLPYRLALDIKFGQAANYTNQPKQ